MFTCGYRERDGAIDSAITVSFPPPPPPRQKAREALLRATVLNANWKSATYDLATRETPAITPRLPFLLPRELKFSVDDPRNR